MDGVEVAVVPVLLVEGIPLMPPKPSSERFELKLTSSRTYKTGVVLLEYVVEYEPGNEDGEVVAVAGVAVHVNIYYGRYLYVYDLVVRGGQRSKGYGGLLMDHVEAFDRREGCETAALAVSLDREGAQRLYERRGYQKPSYAMRKALS